ncbi:MAG: hypothetical protein ABI533_07480 [Betaproteobacteria bacterium]
MRSLRLLVMSLVTALACAFAVPSHASFGTNFSDQWWNPNESGWGASVLQQDDTIFVDLFVYGTDGRPTWFTAAAYYQPQSGRSLFTGDLYATTGPWFGAFFNPAAVTVRKVGTLQFDATSTDFATLTYSVDGVVVVKSVQRQLFTYEDFTGSYYGGLIYDQSGCVNAVNNGHVEELGPFQINHAANHTFTLALQSNFGNCSISGNYTQLGHMGTVNSNYTCDGGLVGTITLYELERTGTGMTGRFVGDNNACHVSGSLGGVQR